MKSLILSIVLVTFSCHIVAQVTPEWVRYPVISPNAEHIAFTYKGDIYSVSSTGGQATRLTFHAAHDYKPVWSHDSTKLAFASNRYGNFDIYTMDAEGGNATRLTFHSSNEEPYTFTQDNTRILFKGVRMDLATHRQYPTGRQAELYSIAVSGGRVDQVLTVPAEDVQLSNDGSALVYHDNKGFENPWRKHHRSAITRDIWSYNIANGEHAKLTSFNGEDRNPVYSSDGKSLYYLSEQNGSFNVHQLNIKRPSRVKELTSFDTHPVRFLSKGQKNGNDVLAFSHHGILHTMVVGEKANKVSVSIRTQDVSNHQEMADVNGDISEMDISPNGKEIAFISNGEVFVSANDGSFTKQITDTASQERFVKFSHDGSFLVYAAERDNKWSIFKAEKVRDVEPFFYAASLIKETVLVSNELDNYQPQISPDGKKLAYIEDRRSLRVMDMASLQSITLIEPNNMIHMRDGDQNFSWSPDSKWILLQHDKLLNNSDIALIDASGNSDMKTLIPSGYYDYSPKWVNGGKQIMWFSNRHGMRNYATSGRTQSDVYTLFFKQQDWDKFNLSENDFELMNAIEEAAEEAKEEDTDNSSDSDDSANKDDDESESKAVDDIEIEWKGLDDRRNRLTIHSSMLADAVLNDDASKLYYLSRFEDNYDLWETDLRTKDTRKAIKLNTGYGSLMWDHDMENLYLLSRGSISKIDVEGESDEGVSISQQVLIDQQALRQHSFDHVWLRTSKIFYEPTYHGINWENMREQYKPKVAHIGNQYEFTELLSEMLGELNVSHAGAGFRGRSEQGDATASLGIFYDYKHQGNGIKITEVINGGPLDKAKFNVSAGMVIEKIDGQIITSDIDWAHLLNRKAGKFVLLELTTADSDPIQITVKPISLESESDLLYERFIDINEQEVYTKSKGKLGYVHIPGMSDGPYRNVFDKMMGKHFDKKAVVVDTRFNGGGDLVADLAMFFTGEQFLTYATASKQVGAEPTSRYTKPVISLFNESMYSDGHCYASGYKDLKLGKSVGMPVPGTCSFAGWEGLPMGGYWGVVPVSAKNKKGEWLENNETAPDILIKNQPGVIDFGRDQQLERAIKELLKTLR